MSKSVSEKIGIKANMRALFVDAPEDFIKKMESEPLELKSRLAGKFDYIHFFVVTQKHMHKKFETLINHLTPSGKLWVSWPKSKQKGSDLTLPKVIEIGYDYGMVESKTISIDSVWSAIKFTHPKEGKEYNNSYGTLK